MSEEKQVRYYEIWSEISQSAKWSRIISIIISFAFLVMLLAFLRMSSKPLMVVRVDTLGNPAIVEARKENTISPQEVQNFVLYFVNYWRGLDYYSYDDNFRRLFDNMMTSKMISAGNGYLQENKIIETIKSEQLRYKIKISQVTIKSLSRQSAVVEVSGVREEGSYKPNSKVKTINFIATLNLLVVPRTTSPWGLLCDGYEEKVFN